MAANQQGKQPTATTRHQAITPQLLGSDEQARLFEGFLDPFPERESFVPLGDQGAEFVLIEVFQQGLPGPDASPVVELLFESGFELGAVTEEEVHGQRPGTHDREGDREEGDQREEGGGHGDSESATG